MQRPAKLLRTRAFRAVLLALPIVAWLFPWVYARSEPKLGPFTFFIWYQFAVSVATGLLVGVVFLLRPGGTPK